MKTILIQKFIMSTNLNMETWEKFTDFSKKVQSFIDKDGLISIFNLTIVEEKEGIITKLEAFVFGTDLDLFIEENEEVELLIYRKEVGKAKIIKILPPEYF